MKCPQEQSKFPSSGRLQRCGLGVDMWMCIIAILQVKLLKY